MQAKGCVSHDGNTGGIKISERMTRCKQVSQRGNGKETLQHCLAVKTKTTREDCTWNDRVCRAEMVRDGQGESNNEVLCTTVEQKSVRLGTDTKHSEVQNLFSQPRRLQVRFSKASIGSEWEHQLKDWITCDFKEEWVIASAMRGLAVLRDHDPRRDVLSAFSLFQSLLSTVNRLSDSSRFPEFQHQTHENTLNHDNNGCPHSFRPIVGSVSIDPCLVYGY